ncbi:MAG TPA: TonB-dependent receptor [Thermoanaerobaculia bacterium]|nr:TonB-dependent receptor [Thermoanaerobaculia bacterium]
MKKLVVLFSCILMATAGAMMGAVTTGTIQVIVTDNSGAPLPGVTVSAAAEDVSTTRTDVTNADGTVNLISLAPSTRYVVDANLEGFGKAQTRNVVVRSAQTATVRMTLAMAAVSESITVTADAPIVDTTSAAAGQELTLELTESLPTGRSYQSYLELVPGVLPARAGNPASRSGVNYSDIAGDLGQSTDNFYYIEGINVTDPVTGTFGANLNTEIIQEQKVLTGGIPAEFAGAPGLLSSVVTKAGSNNFSGSLNYYTQNEGLVADNEHSPAESFSTYDTAVTLGGPIVRDKAWFFGSYRMINRETDVTAQDSLSLLRTVENESRQAFGKLSWQVTDKDRLALTYTDDPTEISGQVNRQLLNTRDFTQEQGGNRYIAEYNRVFSSNFLLDAAVGKHNGEVSTAAAIDDIRNSVIFWSEDARSLSDEQLGGEGNININERDTDFMKGSLEGLFDTNWGSHTLKFGGEAEEHINFRNSNFVGGAQYTSLANIWGGRGVTAGHISAGEAPGQTCPNPPDEGCPWSALEFDVNNASDFGGLINTINASPDRAFFYNLLDLNRDGTITSQEAAQAIVFNSTAGNPHGAINYQRDLQTAEGPQETTTDGLVFYLQDTWQMGQWAVNLGVRAERWEHFATTGENIFTFDWTYAPRISAIYDILGNGRQKVSAYYGRYYDPIRLNMTNFAGTLTGRILEEQVWIQDRWVTYRTRGGPVVQDAFFAPTTKTPYTDEYQLSYQIDLGRNMSFETNLVRRHTRDILEDYDLSIYADDANCLSSDPDAQANCHYSEGFGVGNPGAANSLYLGLDYFGYTANPGSNFVIATLAGGKRDYDGIDLIFRKRWGNNWQMLSSYTWSDAKGNTNSDSNADFQGDVLFLDPRAPNQYGRQPGSIEHLFKVAGSYRAFNRLELGAVYNWNSGAYSSRTFRASGRNLPIRIPTGDAFEFGGVTARWIEEGAVGGVKNPSYGTLDLRAQWNQPIARTTLELFLDVFNVLDDQATIRTQDLVAGNGGISFGQPLTFVEPRRFFLGARLLF